MVKWNNLYFHWTNFITQEAPFQNKPGKNNCTNTKVVYLHLFNEGKLSKL